MRQRCVTSNAARTIREQVRVWCIILVRTSERGVQVEGEVRDCCDIVSWKRMRYAFNQAILTEDVRENGVTDTPPW